MSGVFWSSRLCAARKAKCEICTAELETRCASGSNGSTASQKLHQSSVLISARPIWCRVHLAHHWGVFLWPCFNCRLEVPRKLNPDIFGLCSQCGDTSGLISLQLSIVRIMYIMLIHGCALILRGLQLPRQAVRRFHPALGQAALGRLTLSAALGPIRRLSSVSRLPER